MRHSKFSFFHQLFVQLSSVQFILIVYCFHHTSFSVGKVFRPRRHWIATIKRTPVNARINVIFATKVSFKPRSYDHIYSIIPVKMDLHATNAAVNSIEKIVYWTTCCSIMQNRAVMEKRKQKVINNAQCNTFKFGILHVDRMSWSYCCKSYAVSDFKCSTCQKAYSSKTTLTAHEKTHQTIDPNMCKFCKIEFKKQSAYEKHMQTEHPLYVSIFFFILFSCLNE